ncbi:DUF5689 domain-containing protein [Cellulophaga sp. L1A9]|uniref:DUF5689 domain-containing protein n=1 Tax=Cellulophaga sp. L1A9 TaxID=2686362 RepID=UPI00131D308B|nr:DUF5689 domain-containing protein [Cellulophaga sp. L1A9]
MANTSILFKYIFWIILFIMLPSSCVKNRDFDEIQSTSDKELVANSTFLEVFSLYKEGTVQIQDDLVIEGYVISSDEAGNFFGTLYFQDKSLNPTLGLQVELDVRDSHLFYPVGSKILIKLKGLYLGKSKDVYKIGGVFTSFGNASVGRLPASIVNQHIFPSCEDTVEIEPTVISLEDDLTNYRNTLVRIAQIEFSNSELGQTYAVKEEETDKILIDCLDHEIRLRNSGYSDFQHVMLPEGSGAITGLLLHENEDYFLVIRDEKDVTLSNERCEDFIDEFSSNSVFISEIADPDNNSGARFIELYNSGPAISLKNWQLLRHTNENTTVGAAVDLTGTILESRATLVISPNEEEFTLVYGFAPDIVVNTGSAADSNGDDTLVLVDPFGAVIDVFGIIGEDGSGTQHEFEDGKALRNQEITRGNPVFVFLEWDVYNDTGDSGTINMPQNAPEDFTPGIR